MGIRIRSLLGALAVSAAVLITGCGGDTPKPQSSAPVKVTAGMLRLTSSAPLFIGVEKGFFKEEGLDVTPEWFDAAQPIVVATASNKIDVGGTGITAALYNMVAQGQKLVIVADKGREDKSVLSSGLVVTTDNYDAGVRSVADLKGKKVGITQTGSTFEYEVGRLLELQGLSKADVELVPLGKISSIMAALESKQIDAAILVQPNVSRAENAGFAKMILSVGDAMDYQTSGIFYSPEFAAKKNLGVKFMKAYIKSVRYYSEAVLGKDKGANYDEVLDIIAKYTNTPKETVAQGLPYLDPNGALLVNDIQTQIDWYTKEGLIVKPLKASDVVDTSFQETAAKEVK